VAAEAAVAATVARPSKAQGEVADAGDIAARTIEARDQAKPDGVGALGKDNGNARGSRLGGKRRSDPAGGRDQRRRKANQIGHQSRQPAVVAFGPAIFDFGGLAIDIAGIAQPALKRCHVGPERLGRAVIEKPDQPASPAAAHAPQPARPPRRRPA
jgi:hypothetical protein